MMNSFEDAFKTLSSSSSSSSSSSNNHQQATITPTQQCALIYPIGRIVLWVDFMYERVTSDIPVNTEELAHKFKEKYLSEAKMFELPNITVGQLITFRFQGKILKLVAKEMESIHDEMNNTENNVKSSRKIEIGHLVSQSIILFEKIPGSILKLTGNLVEIDSTEADQNRRQRSWSLVTTTRLLSNVFRRRDSTVANCDLVVDNNNESNDNDNISIDSTKNESNNKT